MYEEPTSTPRWDFCFQSAAFEEAACEGHDGSLGSAEDLFDLKQIFGKDGAEGEVVVEDWWHC